MIELVASVFGALREMLGFRREQANRVNTPEMRTNAAAKVDAEIRAESAEAVAKAKAGDLEAIRRLTSD